MQEKNPQPSPAKARDHALDRLLSGKDAPAVTEREALFARIEATLAPPRAKWWAPSWGFGALGAAAAAAVLVVVVAKGPGDDPFRARGGEQASLQVQCVEGGAVAPCRQGGELVLEVRATTERPHVAAFSQRPDGVIVWYSPEQDGESAPVKPGSPLAFRMGHDHPPGAYRLFAVLSAGPLDRAAVAEAMGDELAGGPSVTVVERAFEIRAESP